MAPLSIWTGSGRANRVLVPVAGNGFWVAENKYATLRSDNLMKRANPDSWQAAHTQLFTKQLTHLSPTVYILVYRAPLCGMATMDPGALNGYN